MTRSGAARRAVSAGVAIAAALAAVAPAVAGVPQALPAAEPFPAELHARLDAALTAATQAPRTRHLDPSGAPLFSNRLLLEASPYLRQHAHNPVDWHPWGEEAFEKARRLDRPVLVSIGYSTCHWCHVMEEESFDDIETAKLLNAGFVAIKVDREMRPDVDAVYMAAIHAMGQRGGWPLNVFLTPDRRPFYAGTYFPPQDGRGRPGFPRVLTSISDEWQKGSSSFRATAKKLGRTVASSLGGQPAFESRAIDPGAVERAVRAILPRADREWGGYGRGTKFPSSMPLRLMLRAHARLEAAGAKDPAPEGENPGGGAKLAAEISHIVRLTLDKMASGGIRDAVGGGFHRYSTERRWLIPHFEKMLYDNAQLALLYTEAWQWSGEERDAEVARDTLAYLDREMSAPGGGFYSATDADSATPAGEMEEGRFFTWTPDEIRAALALEDALAAIAWWGVTASGQLDGRSILHEWRSEADVAKQLGISISKLRASLARSRATLYSIRAKRRPPLLDDKVLVGWNGLAISAFARAGFAFDDAALRERAARAASFVLERMRSEGRLQRAFVAGRVVGPAFLSDHAFLIAGLLDLYEASGEPRWLAEAIALQKSLDANHADEAGGGYFQTAHDSEVLIAREKPMSDGAVPSGNSVAALNLVRLQEITGDESYGARLAALLSALEPLVARNPSAFGELLLAVDFERSSPKEIVIVQPELRSAGAVAAATALLAPLRRGFVPSRVLLDVVEGARQDEMEKLSPLVANKRTRGGQPTAYVCENRVCALPTADPAVFAQQLGLTATR